MCYAGGMAKTPKSQTLVVALSPELPKQGAHAEALERKLTRAVKTAGVGKWENTASPIFDIILVGASADEMQKVIKPILRKEKLPYGCKLLKYDGKEYESIPVETKLN